LSIWKPDFATRPIFTGSPPPPGRREAAARCGGRPGALSPAAGRREGKLRARALRSRHTAPAVWPMRKKRARRAALRLVGVAPEHLVVAPAVREWYWQPAERGGRSRCRDVDVQARARRSSVQRRGAARAVAHADECSPTRPVGLQRRRPSFDGNHVAAVVQPARPHLDALPATSRRSAPCCDRPLLAITCHGSRALRIDRLMPRAATSPNSGKRNSKCARTTPDRSRTRLAELRQHVLRSPSRRRSAAGSGRAARSPARQARGVGLAPEAAMSARSSSCCARLIRACGGISKARSSAARAPFGRRASRACDAETRRGGCCR